MSSTIKALHLVNGEFYAGAERVQDHLALCLPKEGVDVVFACLKPRDFPLKTTASDTLLLEFPMSSRFDFTVVWALSRYAKKRGFDLIHAHSPRALLVGALVSISTGLPLLYHVHSPTDEDTEYSVRNWINSFVEKLSLLRAKRLIAVSEAMRTYALRTGRRPSEVTVVHNGVPALGQLPPRLKPESEWILGTVAFFRPRKGLDVLITALGLVVGEGLNVRLRIVGSFEQQDYENEMLELTSSLSLTEHVDWVGFSTDVSAELSKIDLFVLPSLFGEGLPMVILEAMAAGIPVVSTRVEGIPEAVREGVDGRLADPGDAVSLANALRLIVSGQDDWEKMREMAFARQQNMFSDRSMAKGVAEVYRTVLQFSD